MTWSVETLDKRVDREIKSLPKDIQADLIHVLELIEEFGPRDVGAPHVRPLDGRSWEIRARGKSGHGRAVYVIARERRLVILTAFHKKTQTTPRRVIELAKLRARDAGL